MVSEKTRLNQRHWLECPEMCPIKEGQIDLRGLKFGKFTVVGKYGKSKHNGTLWVVRCECGHFESRCNRAIKNPHNFGDRCELCRKIANEKRREILKYVIPGTKIDARKL